MILLIATAPALLAAAQPGVATPGTSATELTPAAASTPEPVAESPGGNGDPLEPVNRASYALNSVLDRVVFRPIAMTYRRVLPRPVRNGVTNALGTWGEPVVAINDALQGDLVSAEHTTARFVVNVSVGLLGVFDVAQSLGLPRRENGFAVTLGKYGVGAGAYLFIPGYGPSSVRDIVGYGLDTVSNPLVLIRHVRTGLISRVAPVVEAVDMRVNVESDLREVELTATDPYATIRSVYQQRMHVRIRGEADFIEEFPSQAEPPSPAPPPPKVIQP